MRRRTIMGASLAAALLVGSALAAGDLESGPAVGKHVGAFDTLHCTGPGAGSKSCLV